MAFNCTLAHAIGYDNAEVVARFTQQYRVGREEADDIFLETKKWIWLAAQPHANAISIIDPLLVIDEMWHNFILFTGDYTRYCFERFGRYIHHQPTTQAEKKLHTQQFESDPEIARNKADLKLQKQCSLVCNQLGVATLLKWYVEFPKRYGEEFFNDKRVRVSVAHQPSTELQALAQLVAANRVQISDSPLVSLGTTPACG